MFIGLILFPISGRVISLFLNFLPNSTKTLLGIGGEISINPSKFIFEIFINSDAEVLSSGCLVKVLTLH